MSNENNTNIIKTYILSYFILYLLRERDTRMRSCLRLKNVQHSKNCFARDSYCYISVSVVEAPKFLNINGGKLSMQQRAHILDNTNSIKVICF